MWSKQTLQFEIKTIHYFELELAEYYAKNIDHKQEFCTEKHNPRKGTNISNHIVFI